MTAIAYAARLIARKGRSNVNARALRAVRQCADDTARAERALRSEYAANIALTPATYVTAAVTVAPQGSAFAAELYDRAIRMQRFAAQWGA